MSERDLDLDLDLNFGTATASFIISLLSFRIAKNERRCAESTSTVTDYAWEITLGPTVLLALKLLQIIYFSTLNEYFFLRLIIFFFGNKSLALKREKKKVQKKRIQSMPHTGKSMEKNRGLIKT